MRLSFEVWALPFGVTRLHPGGCMTASRGLRAPHPFAVSSLVGLRSFGVVTRSSRICFSWVAYLPLLGCTSASRGFWRSLDEVGWGRIRWAWVGLWPLAIVPRRGIWQGPSAMALWHGFGLWSWVKTLGHSLGLLTMINIRGLGPWSWAMVLGVMVWISAWPWSLAMALRHSLRTWPGCGAWSWLLDKALGYGLRPWMECWGAKRPKLGSPTMFK